MTHERYEENVAAYLLGALPELERQAFERHAERCGDCHSALEWLRPAADVLARAATPLTPPPRLKTALMEVIEREARAPPMLKRARRLRRHSARQPRAGD